MGLAMWVAQPSYHCALIEEPPRRLLLTRQLDREHLQRDGAKIQEAARRYASRLPSPRSAEREIANCEESLARVLAAAHDVPLEELRAAMPARLTIR
jgi:hypothetical protein